jgi:hypothetical protein
VLDVASFWLFFVDREIRAWLPFSLRVYFTMGKSRVAVRLKEKAGRKSHNRSEDLAKLTEQYNVFIKRLEGLVAVSCRSTLAQHSWDTRANGQNLAHVIAQVHQLLRNLHTGMMAETSHSITSLSFVVSFSYLFTGSEEPARRNATTRKIKVSGPSQQSPTDVFSGPKTCDFSSFLTIPIGLFAVHFFSTVGSTTPWTPVEGYDAV